MSVPADQLRRQPEPVGEIGRDEQAEHQHQSQVREHRQQRRGMRQALARWFRRTPSAARGGKSPANATPSAISRIGVAHGCSRIAVVRIRNSLANTPKGGMPRMASVPSIRPQPTVGTERDQAADVVHDLGARPSAPRARRRRRSRTWSTSAPSCAAVRRSSPPARPCRMRT